MFSLPFWIIFGLGILVSLGVSIVYGRRAIHPRLRPHFGQVVVVFLIMTLVWFGLSLLLGNLIGGGMENFDPEKLNQEGEDAKRPPARKVEERSDSLFE